MKTVPSSTSSVNFLPNTVLLFSQNGHRTGYELKNGDTLPSPACAKARRLTVLLVEHNFSFELYLLLQGFFYLKHQLLVGLHTKQKLATAALLHDFSSCKPSQLTEAIGTVDYGEPLCNLGIGQDEVAIWRKQEDIQPLKALL